MLSGYLAVNPEFVKNINQVSTEEIEEYKQNLGKVKLLKKAVADLWAEKPLDYFAKEYGNSIQEWRNSPTFDFYRSALSGLSARDDQDSAEDKGR